MATLISTLDSSAEKNEHKRIIYLIKDSILNPGPDAPFSREQIESILPQLDSSMFRNDKKEISKLIGFMDGDAAKNFPHIVEDERKKLEASNENTTTLGLADIHDLKWAVRTGQLSKADIHAYKKFLSNKDYDQIMKSKQLNTVMTRDEYLQSLLYEKQIAQQSGQPYKEPKELKEILSEYEAEENIAKYHIRLSGGNYDDTWRQVRELIKDEAIETTAFIGASAAAGSVIPIAGNIGGAALGVILRASRLGVVGKKAWNILKNPAIRKAAEGAAKTNKRPRSAPRINLANAQPKGKIGTGGSTAGKPKAVRPQRSAARKAISRGVGLSVMSSLFVDGEDGIFGLPIQAVKEGVTEVVESAYAKVESLKDSFGDAAKEILAIGVLGMAGSGQLSQMSAAGYRRGIRALRRTGQKLTNDFLEGAKEGRRSASGINSIYETAYKDFAIDENDILNDKIRQDSEIEERERGIFGVLQKFLPNIMSKVGSLISVALNPVSALTSALSLAIATIGKGLGALTGIVGIVARAAMMPIGAAYKFLKKHKVLAIAGAVLGTGGLYVYKEGIDEDTNDWSFDTALNGILADIDSSMNYIFNFDEDEMVRSDMSGFTGEGEYARLASVVRFGESNVKDSYNVLSGKSSKWEGAEPPKYKNLTDMTVNEVLNYQGSMIRNGHASTAVGKYQFIRGTLTELINKLGIDRKAKFDEALQDRLFIALADEAGYRKWLNDPNATDTDLDNLINRLAGKWASLKGSGGTGLYDDDGVNKGTVDFARLKAILIKEKNQYLPIAASNIATNVSFNTHGNVVTGSRLNKAVKQETLIAHNNQPRSNNNLTINNTEGASSLNQTSNESAELLSGLKDGDIVANTLSTWFTGHDTIASINTQFYIQ